ncbi:hypothetical protein BDW67DRAFT_9601 [Aspergillus spinulosporus]
MKSQLSTLQKDLVLLSRGTFQAHSLNRQARSRPSRTRRWCKRTSPTRSRTYPYASSEHSIIYRVLHGSIGSNCIGIAMNPKQKTAIIVVALVLVPIILVCCAFALALGCAEFWSSGRFTLIKPWIRRQLATVRKQLKPRKSDNPRAVKQVIGRNNTANTGTAMTVAEV